MMADTFNLTLEDALFVVHELPQADLFTRDLWRWIEEQEAAEERRAEIAARHADQWNRFLWRVVTR